MPWQANNKDKFINPYSFVPLGSGCARQQGTAVRGPEAGGDSAGAYVAELLTGSITCELIPKTDLFIPNTSNEDAFGFQAETPDHKSYEFYSYDDLTGVPCTVSSDGVPKSPVIPGSEIRGVIRSAYEILTDSCFNIDYDEDLYTRTPTAKRPGIIVKDYSGHYRLYEAYNVRLARGATDINGEALKTGDIVRCKIERHTNIVTLRDGQKITVYTYSAMERVVKLEDAGIDDVLNKVIDKRDSSYDRKLKTAEGKPREISRDEFTGIVLNGEDTAEKKYEHLFIISTKTAKQSPGIDEGVSKMSKVLQLYRDKTVNLHLTKDKGGNTGDGGANDVETTGDAGDANDERMHTGYSGDNNTYSMAEIDHGSPYPVYYQEVKGRYYFSPACITKNIYYNTLKNIIKNSAPGDNSYLPCGDKNNLCPACRLFGTVTEGKGHFATAARVRFSDAAYTGANPPEYKNVITLPEQAGPKFRCVEFYTHVRDEKPKYWNFDFDDDGKDISEKIEVKGRKMYLCHTPVYPPDIDRNERNCSVRPLKAKRGAVFTFKVFFDKVTETELKRLLAVLSNGGNENKLYHKMGKGKPLGLGSVKIKVAKVILRNIASLKNFAVETVQYKSLYEGAGIAPLEDESVFTTDEHVKRAYIKISDSSTTGRNTVSYPKARNDDPNIKDEVRDASYHWFVGERTLNTPNSMKPRFNYPLPDISEKDISLPSLRWTARG